MPGQRHALCRGAGLARRLRKTFRPAAPRGHIFARSRSLSAAALGPLQRRHYVGPRLQGPAGGVDDAPLWLPAGQNDVARLRAIRRRLGAKIDIRIDANEAWTPMECAERIHELEPFGISACEQPVPHADVDALAEIRKQARTPIMLDESLCSMV